MLEICLIKPNTISYTTNDSTKERFSYDNLDEDIEDYTQILKINSTVDLISLIEKYINDNPQIINTTYNVYEDHEYVYQMYCNDLFYLTEENANINKIIINKKENKLASLLTNKLLNIYGNIIIAKFKINYDNTLTQCNMNYNDMIQLIYNKRVKYGVLIKPNNELINIEYVVNPMDIFHNKQNYKYYEFVYLNKIILFFIEINPQENILNEYATKLYYNFSDPRPIYGQVYIALREKDEEYVNDLNNKYDDEHTENFSFVNDVILDKIMTTLYDSNFNHLILPNNFGYNHVNFQYIGFYNYLFKYTVENNIKKLDDTKTENTDDTKTDENKKNNIIKKYNFNSIYKKESLNMITKKLLSLKN
jgi:hypothetical protein